MKPFTIALFVLGLVLAVSPSPRASVVTNVSSQSLGYYDPRASFDLDGDVVAIGSPCYYDPLSSGSITRYGLTSDGWIQQASISDWNPVQYMAFGTDIAVSGDTVLVGILKQSGSEIVHAVLVYTYSAGQFQFQTELVPEDLVTGETFGVDMVISGETAVITSTRALYVFVRSGTTWSQQARMPMSSTPIVAIEGDRIVYSTGGSVVLLYRTGNTWSENSQIPLASTRIYTLSLSGDSVAVGARNAARLFRRVGSQWTEKVILPEPMGYPAQATATYYVRVLGDLALVARNQDYPVRGGFVDYAPRVSFYVYNGTSWVEDAVVYEGPHVPFSVGLGPRGAAVGLVPLYEVMVPIEVLTFRFSVAGKAYTFEDVKRAFRMSSGLASVAGSQDLSRLDVAPIIPDGSIDQLDVVALARKVSGLTANP